MRRKRHGGDSAQPPGPFSIGDVSGGGACACESCTSFVSPLDSPVSSAAAAPSADLSLSLVKVAGAGSAAAAAAAGPLESLPSLGAGANADSDADAVASAAAFSFLTRLAGGSAALSAM